jgi:hypothetical protein
MLTPSLSIRSIAWLAMPVLVAAALVVARNPSGGISSDRKNGKVLHDAADDPVVQSCVRRIESKDRIVEDVRAGRRTLFEAAAMFRRLDQRPPGRIPHVEYLAAPVDHEDEQYCRQVIRWVEAVVEFEGNHDDGTARRLRAELEEAIRGRRNHIPTSDVPPTVAGRTSTDERPP